MPIVCIPQFHSKPTDETKEGGFHVVERNECLGKDQPQVLVSKSDAEMIDSVYHILKSGNDVEIRESRNGEPRIFEVSKRKVSKHN